jgi:syntaxin 1B/2/3
LGDNNQGGYGQYNPYGNQQQQNPYANQEQGYGYGGGYNQASAAEQGNGGYGEL